MASSSFPSSSLAVASSPHAPLLPPARCHAPAPPRPHLGCSLVMISPAWGRSTRTRTRTRRPLLATSDGPPPPPPSRDDQIVGLQVALSKIQDRVRVFFAVLFWMSLFFWASAWDGRDSSRKNKGPRLPK